VKETLTRSLTGIVFIALIILSLVLHPAAYLVLFGLACAGAWFEIARMFPDVISAVLKVLIAFMLCGSFVLVYFIAGRYLPSIWMLLPPVLTIVLLFMLYMFGRPASPESLPYVMSAAIWLLAGFSLMHFLVYPSGTDSGYSPRWILFTFYLLWMNDTMAYVCGRLAGRHPVWPSVSPGKTWEGSLGGALFTIGLALLFSRYYPQLSAWEWGGFAIIIIVFGSLGDFYESMLKRKAGVKDSGRLLPGHGGILDRLDSFLLSIPFVAVYLKLVL